MTKSTFIYGLEINFNDCKEYIILYFSDLPFLRRERDNIYKLVRLYFDHLKRTTFFFFATGGQIF